MFGNVSYNLNQNIQKDDVKRNTVGVTSYPSFKANTNAVDNTPQKDVYQAQQNAAAPEMDMGQKYIKYGVPAGLALYAGSELFDTLNQGSYEKSLLGRLGKFGDAVSNSKLMQNSFVNKVSSHASSLNSKVKTFISNHETLRSMVETPTKPESSMVVGFLETQAEDDYKKGLECLQKEFLNKNPKTLNLAGATEAEINALKSKYGVNMFGRINNEKKAVEEFLINKIGNELGHTNLEATVSGRENVLAKQLERYQTALKNNSINGQPLSNANKVWLNSRIANIQKLQAEYRKSVLTNLKLRSMGLDKNALAELKNNPVANGSKIEKALEASSKYSKKVSAAYNKVKSITAPTTKLGKLLPKMAKLGMRGLTFGGGFVNCLLMLGFFMSEPVKNAIDAPKDKKVATSVHGFFDAMSWVISMPIALKTMHAVNGLKNIGKNKTQVDDYMSALKTFNKNVKAGLYSDKAVYDSKLAELLSKKNAGNSAKGFKKVLSGVAKFLSVGLEQIAPYKAPTKNLSGSAKIAAKLGNITRALPNFGRNFVGYPLRFGLYMFAFQPIVDKLFSGPITAVFGKPYDPEKEKEEAEKLEKQAKIENAKNAIPEAGWFSEVSKELAPTAKEGLNSLNYANISDNNMIKNELQKRGSANTQAQKTPVSLNNGYINSVNGVSVTTKNDQPLYMPPAQNPANSADNKKVNNSDDNGYDKAPLTYVPTLTTEVPYSDSVDAEIRKKMAEIVAKNNSIVSDIDKFSNKK